MNRFMLGRCWEDPLEKKWKSGFDFFFGWVPFIQHDNRLWQPTQFPEFFHRLQSSFRRIYGSLRHSNIDPKSCLGWPQRYKHGMDVILIRAEVDEFHLKNLENGWQKTKAKCRKRSTSKFVVCQSCQKGMSSWICKEVRPTNVKF